ncbi:MAG TPA: hypothetical protein VFS09_02040 [Candidatus Eisenbacteria bacterium]|nr:hypothetical protein [Candidatus Eisenbacteria bacterium]
MKSLAVVVAVLPLALVAGACSRVPSNRVVAPEPVADATIRDGSWVADREQVARAASLAATHPLVREAIEASGASRLAYTPDYSLRATGRTVRDRSVALTILPYVTGGDPTHATFVSLIENDGETAVSRAEMIWGRDPRSDEPGFEPFILEGVRGWIREDDLRMAPAAAAGGAARSPERFNKLKFLTCFQDLGPQLCSQGIAISNQIAPTVPYHEAVGCGVGTAVAALSCAAMATSK